MEHPKRSFVKSLTWRVIAIVTTMVVVYLYSGDFKSSLMIGLGANFIKFFLYYVHERIWNKVSYGKAKDLEYQI
ncbi:MAG: DUF2061 domain-containing protein [Candidatus Omnitrophota bacterium]